TKISPSAGVRVCSTTMRATPVVHAGSSSVHCLLVFFFFNDPAPTEIYTLSLHDALPISPPSGLSPGCAMPRLPARRFTASAAARSEEHTSELQSRGHLVCRLLLEKKKNTY